MVTSAEFRNGKWQVSGLRDPLAADPAVVLSQSGLNSKRVVGHWESYQALDPAIVLRRLAASLNPPPSVSLSVNGGTVKVTGSAPAVLGRAGESAGRGAARGFSQGRFQRTHGRPGSGICSPARCHTGAYYWVRFKCGQARAGPGRHAGCCCRRVPPTDARGEPSWFLRPRDDFRPRGCHRQRNGEPIPQRGSSRGRPLHAQGAGHRSGTADRAQRRSTRTRAGSQRQHQPRR